LKAIELHNAKAHQGMWIAGISLGDLLERDGGIACVAL
jgi:hypothetical protein